MVFVLDRHKKPLMPCSEKRARLLLDRDKAVVHQIRPFTIRLKDRVAEHSVLQDMRVKIDPGSMTTGMAVTLDGHNATHVPFLGEVAHKRTIKAKLLARRISRRARRNRRTRYRQARFLNRKKADGWLPPSLTARVTQTLQAVEKLRNRLPISSVSVEHVKFDVHRMDKADIHGAEYQQGTLQGYEVREYLLEKWSRACAYCGANQVPLEIEHIVPKSRGGSNRISNLALACHECNQEKGNRTAAEFGYAHVQAQAKQPLKDAALMNATRWALWHRLKKTGLPIEGGSGGRTKMQRIQRCLPKEHYYDALCVGPSTPQSFGRVAFYIQRWVAKGRGTRQMCGTDKFGFPIRHRSRHKQQFGFQTGDLVISVFPKGKFAGTYTGRVTVRATGRFAITGAFGRVDGHFKYIRLLQRNGGWNYEQFPTAPALETVYAV